MSPDGVGGVWVVTGRCVAGDVPTFTQRAEDPHPISRPSGGRPPVSDGCRVLLNLAHAIKAKFVPKIRPSLWIDWKSAYGRVSTSPVALPQCFFPRPCSSHCLPDANVASFRPVRYSLLLFMHMDTFLPHFSFCCHFTPEEEPVSSSNADAVCAQMLSLVA